MILKTPFVMYSTHEFSLLFMVVRNTLFVKSQVDIRTLWFVEVEFYIRLDRIPSNCWYLCVQHRLVSFYRADLKPRGICKWNFKALWGQRAEKGNIRIKLDRSFIRLSDVCGQLSGLTFFSFSSLKHLHKVCVHNLTIGPSLTGFFMS